jgi:hypothetical protein
MTSNPVPEPDLLAFLRGDLPPEEAAEVRRRLAAEPALQGELRALEALFRASREAFEPADDPREAERVAAVVRDRAQAEERRAARERRAPARGRRVWVRVLAASVFVHAAVLAFLVWRAPERRAAERGAELLRATLPQERTAVETDRDRAPEVAWPRGGAFAETRFPDPVFPDVLPDSNERSHDAAADGLPELRTRLRQHPPSVALDMLVRTDDVLKRRRLERLKLDPDGTLTRVRLGLNQLALRQNEDGSFDAAGGRTAVGETALAMLPFLGEGGGSASPDARETVARGVAWLRGALFDERSGRDARLRDEGVPVVDLGVALTALAEDFMLSFGRLSPADAGRRASEMEAVVGRIARRQGTDGGFVGSSEDASAAAWPIWGLYAAARTGAVAVPREAIERFRRWYDERPRTTDGIPLRPDGTPDAVLAAVGLLFERGLEGTTEGAAADRAGWMVGAGLPERDGNLFAVTAGSALLLHDPASFGAWGRDTADAIAGRLDARSVVREGDPVGDTALVLLALQAAYRTY